MLNWPSYHTDVFSRGRFESSIGVNAAVCRRSIEEDSLAVHRLSIFSFKTVQGAYEYENLRIYRPPAQGGGGGERSFFLFFLALR